MSMEEVREDITLPSLHNPIIIAAANSAFDGGKNLRDNFLNKDPTHYPYNKRLLISPSPTGGGSGGFLSGGCRTPPPAAVLSLKSGHLDQFLESSKSPRSQLQLHSQVVCADKISSSCKKRASGNEDDDGDRRHKRLIKNRESADRSRARRQAYTNELEQEMAELKKENAKLRRQLEKVGSSATATAASAQRLNSIKGRSLGRTLTAPF